MSKFDNELIKAIGITATAVGKYLQVSPQSISNGIRTKKNYISEAKIANLQDILQKEGELDILQRLNQFLKSQEQPPMLRFYSDHKSECFVNVRTLEFEENIGWIVEELSSNNLKSDIVIFTPHIEEIKQLILSKGLSGMSVETARQGVNNNIRLIKTEESMSPVFYLDANGCYIYSAAQTFIELPKEDSLRIETNVIGAANCSPLLIKQWSSMVVPFMVLLQEVKMIMDVDSAELLSELINFFQNNNASINTISWGLLALRIKPDKKPYQCSSTTPYSQLLDFVTYISDNTEGSVDSSVIKEADDIKRCLNAVKLL